MQQLERFKLALASPEPDRNLRKLAELLTSEGQTKEEVYALFESFLIEMRGLSPLQEKDEDAILDVMDALTGWCHEDIAIRPES